MNLSLFLSHKTACKQPCWSKQTKNNTTVSVWGWNEMTNSRLIPTLNNHQFFLHLEIPFKGDFWSLALDRLHIVGDSLWDFGRTMSHWYKTQQYEMEKLIGGQQIFIVGWNTYPLFLFRDITSLDFFTRQTARLCFHCAKTNRHITIGYLLPVVLKCDVKFACAVPNVTQCLGFRLCILKLLDCPKTWIVEYMILSYLTVEISSDLWEEKLI